MKAVAILLWLALVFSLSMLIIDVYGVEAQVFAPGAAQYPSPGIKTFLDQPVAQCVIARPCPQGDCVILTPCGSQLPTPAPPAVSTPKESVSIPSQERTIIIQITPPPAPEAAPKEVAPQAAPTSKAPTPKKPCKC